MPRKSSMFTTAQLARSVQCRFYTVKLQLMLIICFNHWMKPAIFGTRITTLNCLHKTLDQHSAFAYYLDLVWICSNICVFLKGIFKRHFLAILTSLLTIGITPEQKGISDPHCVVDIQIKLYPAKERKTEGEKITSLKKQKQVKCAEIRKFYSIPSLAEESPLSYLTVSLAFRMGTLALISWMFLRYAVEHTHGNTVRFHCDDGFEVLRSP